MVHKVDAIHWFRQDLRLGDNPGLSHATAQGTVLAVYVLDDASAGEHKIGEASRWWLHQSLTALNAALDNRLVVLSGDAAQLIPALAKEVGASTLTWNRAYEPWRIARDRRVKAALSDLGASCQSFNGSLLWEPWQVLKDDGTPYRVFSPFFRRGCAKAGPPRHPLPTPPTLDLARTAVHPSGQTAVDGLSLLPGLDWTDGLARSWEVGEAAATKRLGQFLDNGLVSYKDSRNFPSRANVSRLSPYLRWGEISPHTVWSSVQDRIERRACSERDGNHFLSELGWREFSHSLLYHFPDLPRKNLQARFDNFEWFDDHHTLVRWQRGKTGYPIVDAAMRELWQTGYMHNRTRMIVGSFLVKNLRLHWHHGERWFWDCLVDADLANNSASWQWIAGCGADAAPYFRIFNPITQAEKFDPDGLYIRRYLPELARLPLPYLFAPWTAPEEVLTAAGIRLGDTYPQPMVDIAKSRADALAAFAALKQSQ